MNTIRIFLLLLAALTATTATSEVVLHLEGDVTLQTKDITSLRIGADGHKLVVGTAEGAILVYSTEDFDLVAEMAFHKKAVTALVFDPDGEMLYAGSEDKSISQWNLSTGELVSTTKELKAKVRHLVVSASGRILAAAGDSKRIVLWDLPMLQYRGELKGHKGDVVGLAFGNDDRQLLSVGKKKQIISWDIPKMRPSRKTEIEARTLENSGISVTSVHVCDDRSGLFVATEETVLKKGGRDMIFRYNLSHYDWSANSELNTYTGFPGKIDFFDVTPDNNYVVYDRSGLRQNQLALWDITMGVDAVEQEVFGPITAIDVSSDGEWLTAGFVTDKLTKTAQVSIWGLTGISVTRPIATNCHLRGGQESPLITAEGTTVMAVLDFDSLNVSFGMAKSAREFLEADLSNSKRLRLVERVRIGEILKELDLQASGMTVANAARVGRLLNVEWVLLGSVTRIGADLVLTVRLVEVASGQILGSRVAECLDAGDEDLLSLIDLLVPTLVSD